MKARDVKETPVIKTFAVWCVVGAVLMGVLAYKSAICSLGAEEKGVSASAGAVPGDTEHPVKHLLKCFIQNAMNGSVRDMYRIISDKQKSETSFDDYESALARANQRRTILELVNVDEPALVGDDLMAARVRMRIQCHQGRKAGSSGFSNLSLFAKRENGEWRVIDSLTLPQPKLSMEEWPAQLTSDFQLSTYLTQPCVTLDVGEVKLYDTDGNLSSLGLSDWQAGEMRSLESMGNICGLNSSFVQHTGNNYALRMGFDVLTPSDTVREAKYDLLVERQVSEKGSVVWSLRSVHPLAIRRTSKLAYESAVVDRENKDKERILETVQGKLAAWRDGLPDTSQEVNEILPAGAKLVRFSLDESARVRKHLVGEPADGYVEAVANLTYERDILPSVRSGKNRIRLKQVSTDYWTIVSIKPVD